MLVDYQETQNPGATERWTKIHHIVALRKHLNKKTKKKIKERRFQLGTARIERDEEGVKNIMTCIDAWIPEQWKKDQPMTNFATDEIGTDDVNDDITDSKERGEIARDEFVTRFTEEKTTLNYYDLRDHETV